MLKNHLQNKLKKFDEILEGEEKDALNVFETALKQAETITDPELKSMSLDLLRRVKSGEKVGEQDLLNYLKKAKGYAG